MRCSQLDGNYISQAVLWRRPHLGFLTVSPYGPSLSLGCRKDTLEYAPSNEREFLTSPRHFWEYRLADLNVSCCSCTGSISNAALSRRSGCQFIMTT